jgi:RNA polymerase sigma factor (sigma-70 family)
MPVFRGDRGLLDRFRDGDREALARVYGTYVAEVEQILRRGFQISSSGHRVPGVPSTGPDLADLVHDVFLKAFTPAARLAYDGLRDYGPYLFTIARNTLADRARRLGQEVSIDGAALERVLPAVDPAEAGPWADVATVTAVETYLRSLSDDVRRVHQARFVDGLSQRDAAQSLGLSRQNVRTLESRLVDGLRAHLARRAAPDPAATGGRPDAALSA